LKNNILKKYFSIKILTINIVYLLSWLTTIFLYFVFINHYFGIEKNSIVRFLINVFPWLLILVLPIIIFSIVFKKYTLFFVIFLAFLYISFPYYKLFIPHKSQNIESYKTLRVMSFNVWSENHRSENIFEFISNQKLDILFLQEVSKKKFLTIQQGFESTSPEQVIYSEYDNENLLAIFSKYPIRSTKRLGTDRTRILKAVIVMDSGLVDTYNVHFVRGNWKRRDREISSFLSEEISPNTHPIVLAGDCNFTSRTLLYRKLTSLLDNSHEKSGWGFGFTFPANNSALNFPGHIPFAVPALVRIDHIFYSQHFQPLSTQTIKESVGSDHFPDISVLEKKVIKN
jgi:endonuclease/exonuclease/phosphatase (EEP) superfamily protein YafD